MLFDVGRAAVAKGFSGAGAFVIVVVTGVVFATESGARAFVIVLATGVGVRLSLFPGVLRNAGNCVRG